MHNRMDTPWWHLRQCKCHQCADHQSGVFSLNQWTPSTLNTSTFTWCRLYPVRVQWNTWLRLTFKPAAIKPQYFILPQLHWTQTCQVSSGIPMSGLDHGSAPDVTPPMVLHYQCKRRHQCVDQHKSRRILHWGDRSLNNYLNYIYLNAGTTPVAHGEALLLP